MVPATFQVLETAPTDTVPALPRISQTAMVPASSPVVAQSPATSPQNRSQTASSLAQHAVVLPPATEKPVASAVACPTPSPELPKPVAPAKPRTFHIWDSAHTETRDGLISAAGFADLYNMLLDVRFRQEQLRARGLLKEEAALNELLARVVDALEKKKKADGLD